MCLCVCVSVTYEKNKIPYFMQKVYIFIFYTQQCAVKYIFFILQKKYRGVVGGVCMTVCVWCVWCVWLCVAVCAEVSIRSSACF